MSLDGALSSPFWTGGCGTNRAFNDPKLQREKVSNYFFIGDALVMCTILI